MKFFTLLFVGFSFSSCAQNKEEKRHDLIHIYIAGCDSIFYCSGEKFNLDGLKGSKKDDTAFLHQLISEITTGSKTVILKPLGGSCGGVGETLMNLTGLLKKNNSQYTISTIDPAEQDHFNDISLIEAVKQRAGTGERLYINEPATTSKTLSQPFFQFRLKKNGDIYYSYVSTDLNRELAIIKAPTKEKLVQAINSVENKYQLKLNEDQVIINGDVDADYKQFKLIKEALKEKQLFKFKIVATAETGDNMQKLTRKEKKEDNIPLSKNTLVILLADNDQLFYYRGDNCDQLKKIDLKKIGRLLKDEKKNIVQKKLFILIKATKGSTFKNAVDLLDEIVISKIPAGHYAETDITPMEINCIKNHKHL